MNHLSSELILKMMNKIKNLNMITYIINRINLRKRGEKMKKWIIYQINSIVNYGVIGISKKHIDLETIAEKEDEKKVVKFNVNGRIYKANLARDKTNRVSGLGVVSDIFKDANYIVCELDGDTIKLSPDVEGSNLDQEEGFIDFLFETAEKYNIPPENLRPKQKLTLIRRLKEIKKEEEQILEKLKS